jgi:hypothetical protein
MKLNAKFQSNMNMNEFDLPDISINYENSRENSILDCKDGSAAAMTV